MSEPGSIGLAAVEEMIAELRAKIQECRTQAVTACETARHRLIGRPEHEYEAFHAERWGQFEAETGQMMKMLDEFYRLKARYISMLPGNPIFITNEERDKP